MKTNILLIAILLLVLYLTAQVFSAWGYDDEAPSIEQRISCTTDKLVRFNDRTMTLECVTFQQLQEATP